MDIKMTSIAQELGRAPALMEVAGQLAQTFGRVLNASCVRDPDLAPPANIESEILWR